MALSSRRTFAGITIALVCAALIVFAGLTFFPAVTTTTTANTTTKANGTITYTVTTDNTTTTYIVTTSVTGTGSTTAVSSATSETATSVASSTLPCGSPGVYCGRVQIVSGNLTVYANSSVLQVTLLEVGNMYIGSATVSLNGTIIGLPAVSIDQHPGNIILNVQPGQQTVLVLTIPNSTISVQVGETYSVTVYPWIGIPGEPANSGVPSIISITAT